MSQYRTHTLVVGVALVAAACGSSSGDPVATPPSTAGQTTSTAPDPTTTSVGATTTSSPPTTEAPLSVGAGLIVANEDGVFLVDEDFLFQLVTGPVELALDDGQGGLVFQRSSDAFASFPPDPTATIIDYLPADSFEPQQLLVPTGEQYLELNDVQDGSVWYTRREGDTPDTATETLRNYDMATRTVDEFAVTGGWESGSISVSVGGANVVAYWGAEGTSGFQFFADSGSRVSLPGNPYEFEQFCGDGQLFDAATGDLVAAPCYEYAELSEDGRLAYYERSFDGAQTRFILVVVDLDSGDELFRQDLNRPDQGWGLDDIDLGANEVLVNRTQSGEWGAPFINALLIDLDSGDADEVGVSGQARFLSGPMAIS